MCFEHFGSDEPCTLIYLTLKNFGLAIGAVIGFLGIAYGHAYNNEHAKLNELDIRKQDRRNSAASLAAQISVIMSTISSATKLFEIRILDFESIIPGVIEEPNLMA